MLCCSFLFFIGCEKKEKNNINFSKYSFTGVTWIRDNGHDIETIKFNTDGKFSYFCACGNPVNDADLCENYTYNEEKKEIKLECFETTEDMITVIKVVNLTDLSLELDFNGEVRKFGKENN